MRQKRGVKASHSVPGNIEWESEASMEQDPVKRAAKIKAKAE